MNEAFLEPNRSLAKRRFWLLSDLQQGKVELAHEYLMCAMDDFMSLGYSVDGICHLGDSTEGEDVNVLNAIADLQIEQFARIDAPVYYALGNHEFDAYRSACAHGVPRAEAMRVAIRERVANNPQWHMAPRLSDPVFTASVGDDLSLMFFPDHGEENGAWCMTHGLVHHNPPEQRNPYADIASFEPVKKACAEVAGRPFFTLAHGAFSGGNRASSLLARFQKYIPREGWMAHFYGHSHIGDEFWGLENYLRQISTVDWTDRTQFDISSLERGRGSAVRSAILEWYGETHFGVFFRNHDKKVWEKAYIE